MGEKHKDLTGQKINKWTVLNRDPIRKRGHWICQCVCGNTNSIQAYNLLINDSTQCSNCRKKERDKTSYGQINGNYWRSVKKNAKKRSLDFNINIQYAWGLFLSQKGKCALSGENLYLNKDQTASLDRINSNFGYVFGNVQWVHKNVNKIKTNFSDEDFVNWCHKISICQKENKDKANEVIPNLKKHILVDGFDVVVDLHKSFGSWIVDARTGNKYLDLFSQFASQALGWNYPALISRLDQFPEIAWVKITHSDVYTTYYSNFVEKLSKTMPEFNNFFFISTGALAVENALKIAFDWKVQKLGIENDEEAINNLDIVHFKNAFHGRAGYCLSLTNTDSNKIKWFPKFNWTRLTIDNNGLKELENKLINNKNIAAVIIEPILGEGGDIHVTREFLMTLRELTLKYECLLIFDEVQTGFSTGKPWCYQHHKVVSDLLVFGKKIQVCGVASTNRIHEIKNNCFTTSSRINSTWGADIVDLVRSTMILEIIEEENLLNKSKEIGNYFLQKLSELPLKNVRGRGLMIAFDLHDSQSRDVFLHKLNEKIFCLKSGDKSIRFRPHLTISKEEVDFAIDYIKSII